MAATIVKNAAKRTPTAIAMMNMGGPSTLPEVQDFLTNLFTDPEIIPMGPVQSVVGPWVAKNRTPKITDQYAAIGGGSPILKWTNIQGEEMCKLLDEIRPESAPHKHYVFFRYANPLTEASLKQMKEDGVTRAIAFSQYPQWSCTTTGSSMNHLWRELDRLNMTDDFQWSLIDRWNTHPGYISAVANRVRQGLEQFAPEDRDKVVVMFSAHSVPMKVVYKGDPYTKEIASTAERVMEKLGIQNSHILAWQSKVGYLPWMGPSTSNVIKGLGAQGHKHVLTVPIAFTSDHIETLFEIDIEYAEEAKEVGIDQFKRCPSLNDEPLLFEAMADIVKTHLDTKTLHSPQYPLNCPECTNPMCRTIKNPIKPYHKFIQPKASSA
ncbi:Ferrochelatase, partial [Globisporangium splendens]